MDIPHFGIWQIYAEFRYAFYEQREVMWATLKSNEADNDD